MSTAFDAYTKLFLLLLQLHMYVMFIENVSSVSIQVCDVMNKKCVIVICMVVFITMNIAIVGYS